MRGGWPGLLAALVSIGLAAASAPADAGAQLTIGVRGNRLVDGSGRTVQLRGVNRSGLEYACIQGWGFFDSPHPDQIDTPAMIGAMKSWKINVVRVPLNEDCWLGINTPRGRGGTPYRNIVKAYVSALNKAGLYVILDLHVAAPGHVKSTSLAPMADHDHAPAFWRSLAGTFKSNHALIFDLYNEPHNISWACWRDGCTIHAGSTYRTAGMQQLVDAVRSTGATQPLLLGGLSYALDMSQWVAYAPRDPRHQLIASDHNYGGLGECTTSCKAAIGQTHMIYPVIFGELGETDCRHSYIDQMMAFADQNGIGYLGWAWDATSVGGWTCRGGPSLITNYNGAPTGFGVGFRDHLRTLG